MGSPRLMGSILFISEMLPGMASGGFGDGNNFCCVNIFENLGKKIRIFCLTPKRF